MRSLVLALWLGVSASMALAADVLWVDVRSIEEYSESHFPEAINIPYTEIASKIGDYVDSKQQPIRLYCRSGRRSGIAQGVLEDMGYTRASNEGGLDQLMEQYGK